MILNQANVEAYKELMMNPSAHKLKFRSFKDCFEVSESVTALHVLTEQYMDYIDKGRIIKVFVYILMDEVFGPCDGKDDKGNLGYHLKFIEPNYGRTAVITKRTRIFREYKGKHPDEECTMVYKADHVRGVRFNTVALVPFHSEVDGDVLEAAMKRTIIQDS